MGGGGSEHHIRFPGRGPFVGTVTERPRRFKLLYFCKKPSLRTWLETSAAASHPRFLTWSRPRSADWGLGEDLECGFLGFGVPVEFWDLRLLTSREPPVLAVCLPLVPQETLACKS